MNQKEEGGRKKAPLDGFFGSVVSIISGWNLQIMTIMLTIVGEKAILGKGQKLPFAIGSSLNDLLGLIPESLKAFF